MRCLTTPQNIVSLSTSLAAFDKLASSLLLVFAGPEASHQASVVHGYVKGIKAGQCPNIMAGAPNSFMSKVSSGLALFLTFVWTPPSAAGSSADVKTIY